MITLEAFGKNDIRGIYGKTVTEALFYNVGKSYVQYIKQRCKKDTVSLSIVRDARLHSVPLSEALIKGVLEAGGNVINLGMGPTPFGYYSEFIDAQYGKIDGSLIITASHNPPEYNGLKMTCQKASLNEDQIKDVKEITRKVIAGEIDTNSAQGHYEEFDMVENYIQMQIQMFGSNKKM